MYNYFLFIFNTFVYSIKAHILAPMREILTIEQYAERNGIKRDTVYKRIKTSSLGKKDPLAKHKIIAGKHFISVKNTP
jgi:hypothetical protein